MSSSRHLLNQVQVQVHARGEHQHQDPATAPATGLLPQPYQPHIQGGYSAAYVVSEHYQPRQAHPHIIALDSVEPPVLPSDYRTSNLSTLADLTSELGHAAVPTSGSVVSPTTIPTTATTSTTTAHATSKSKKRRPKPKIDLAPDQPPTTQGKPRERVFVAFANGRLVVMAQNLSATIVVVARMGVLTAPMILNPDEEVRTGSQEPVRDISKIHLVQARLHVVDGRDPQPPPVSVAPSGLEAQVAIIPPMPPVPSVSDVIRFGSPTVQAYTSPSTQLVSPSTVFYVPPTLETTHLFNAPLQAVASTSSSNALEHQSFTYGTTYEDREEDSPPPNFYNMTSQPSMLFSKQIWWDTLLSLYHSPSPTHLQLIPSSEREIISDQILADLKFLFRASNYWFSFFHLPTFFSKICHPTRRQQIQPSLVLGLLCIATFWRSSEAENGARGRQRALWLREEAQKALDASWLSGWIDESLAQAAWLLAFFEICAHPEHSTERSNSSMIYLDSLIRSMALTYLDAEDPITSHFTPGEVPRAFISDPSGAEPVPIYDPFTSVSPTAQYPYRPQRPQQQQQQQQQQQAVFYAQPPHHQAPAPIPDIQCDCNKHILSACWAESMEHVPLWAYTPAWDNNWDEGQIMRESGRRLCWSAMTLAAGHMSYTTANKLRTLDLFITDPANYAILFNGESILRSPYMPPSATKDTIWALHDRIYLLWHSCMRMRGAENVSNSQKAQFAISAWLEADFLEQALSKHTCNLERAYIFQGREYLFNGVTALFNRNKAEEWLKHQAAVARRVMVGLSTVTGHSSNLLLRRPFFVFWFMGQVARALTLWESDNTLTAALINCKALLAPIDYLTALWPCPEQRSRYVRLRDRLTSACISAGEAPPSPLDLSLDFPRKWL
ncbi:hypothetical protein ONZ45_g2523 [Pleurotus djamor]|nr:hypothetical protein ONZ45_g2523 [Pleurotus djamor]